MTVRIVEMPVWILEMSVGRVEMTVEIQKVVVAIVELGLARLHPPPAISTPQLGRAALLRGFGLLRHISSADRQVGPTGFKWLDNLFPEVNYRHLA